VTQIFEAAI